MRQTSNSIIHALFALKSMQVLFVVSFFSLTIAHANTQIITDSSDIRALNSTQITSTQYTSESNAPFLITPQEWEGKALSLADLLAKHAGLQTRKTGGMGSFQTISVRGVSGNKVVVCLDGVPLNNVHGGTVDLGHIDLQQIARIEIYKGMVPAEFGGNGIGGVIQLVSKKSQKNSGQVHLRVGSYGQFEGQANINQNLHDSLHFSSTLSYRRADNNYPYLDRNGTEYNTQDDTTRNRQNAKYAQASGTHNWSRIFAKGIANLQINHSYEEGGLPGAEAQDTKVAGYSHNWISPRIQWMSQTFSNQLRFESMAQFRYGLDEFHWSYALDGLGYSNGNTLFQQSGTKQIRGDFSLALLQDLKKLDWEIHLQGSAEQVSPRQMNDQFVNPWQVQRHRVALATQSAYNFSPSLIGQINLQGTSIIDHFKKGILYGPWERDVVDKAEWQNDGAIQGSIFLNPSNSFWSYKFNAGRHFRLPELRERYSTNIGVLPNPDLKAEHGETFELVANWIKKSNRVSVGGFLNFQHNGITWVNSAGFNKAINLSAAQVYGLELESHLALNKNLSTTLQTTLQKSANTSEVSAYKNKQLPNEAHTKSFVNITWSQGIFECSLEGEYQSEVYRDEANRMKIPAQFQANAYASVLPWHKAKIQLALRNIRGEDQQDIYSAYPTPGRHWSLALQQAF